MRAIRRSVPCRSASRRGLVALGASLVLLVAACGNGSDPGVLDGDADTAIMEPGEPDAPAAETADSAEGGPTTGDDGGVEEPADTPATTVEAGTAIVTLGDEVHEFTLDVGCIASGGSIVFSGRAADGRLIGISASLHPPAAQMDSDISLSDQQEDRDARESWRVNEHHPDSEVYSLTVSGKSVAAELRFQRSESVMDPLDGVMDGTLEAACP